MLAVTALDLEIGVRHALRRDALIAATAKAHSMTVVTRNTGDFEKAGVPLINPWLPAPNPPRCPGRTSRFRAPVFYRQARQTKIDKKNPTLEGSG